MTTDEQERRIEFAVAALRVIGIMTDEELAEARERMRHFEDDPDGFHRRVADWRVQGGSGS